MSTSTVLLCIGMSENPPNLNLLNKLIPEQERDKKCLGFFYKTFNNKMCEILHLQSSRYFVFWGKGEPRDIKI